jgi:hypothetical protein
MNDGMTTVKNIDRPISFKQKIFIVGSERDRSHTNKTNEIEI